MILHDVVKSVKNSGFLATVRKEPRLCTKIKRGGGPQTLMLATWQAKWAMAVGPKVAHSSSEIAISDIEVGIPLAVEPIEKWQNHRACAQKWWGWMSKKANTS